MAKKKAARTATTQVKTKELVQTEFIKRHDIPDVVVKAAQEYATAHTAQAKAKTKTDSKRDNLMALMRENDVPKVPVEKGGVTKMVEIESADSVKFVAMDED